MIKNQHNNDIFNLNPQASWIYNPESMVVEDVNKTALKLFGFKRLEFLNLTFTELLFDKNDAPFKSVDTESKKIKKNLYFGVFTFQKKNGNKLKLEINGFKIIFNNKNCIILFGQDVTAQENTHQLNTISGIAKIGYWKLDIKSKKLTWTDEVFKIWGLQKESNEINYQSILEKVHHEDINVFKSNFDLMLTGKEKIDFKHRIVLGDQSVKWAHYQGQILKNEDGKPYAFEGTLQDITTGKNIELKLEHTAEQHKESENRFRAAQDLSPDGFTILKPQYNEKGDVVDFTWVYQNPAIAKINGTSESDLIGKRLLDVFPTHKNNPVFESYVEVANTRNTRVIDSFFAGKILSVPTWLRIVIVPLGNNIAILSQDITQKKIADNAFKQSEARFRTIFEIASLGIVQVDVKTGRILLANTYYEKITGYKFDELQNLSFAELTHPEDREADLKLFNDAANGDRHYQNEKRYIRKDGKIIWVRLHIAFIKDEQENPVRTVAICEDITIQKDIKLQIKDLSDNIPGVVFQYFIYPDQTEAIRSVSKGSYKIWGLSPKEVEKNIDLAWNSTKAGGQFEMVKQSILNSVKNKTKWIAKYRVILSNGEVRTHLGSGTPNFLADGTIVFNSVILDVTKEVKNEELITQASQMAQIGSWEIDLANNVVTWSSMVHELHETDPSHYAPDLKSGIQFYREDFREMVQSKIQECIATGKSFDFEAVLVTTKKAERWVRVNGMADTIQGKIHRVYGSVQDIHERKILELKLQNSLKNLQDYQRALDQTASFSITDTNGIIKEVNQYFCNLSQFSPEELIGNTHRIINSNYHSREFFEEFWQTIKSGNIWRGEVKNKKKDGTCYWVDTTIVPFLDGNEKPFQYLALRIDITARKNAEQKIIDAYEKLKNIAWTQSHIVRAPLARILGIINLIESNYIHPDEMSFWLEQLKKSSLEMDRLVQDIVSEAQLIDLQ